MLAFDFRSPYSWVGFALGASLSLMVIALATPEPVSVPTSTPCPSLPQ